MVRALDSEYVNTTANKRKTVISLLIYFLHGYVGYD